MPDTLRAEYNPLIMGFTQDRGPLITPLRQAREIYGKLPSEYRLLSHKEGRQVKKALNLDIGRIITSRLKSDQESLKKRVINFFSQWHRSYEDEFNVHITPFLNLNRVTDVKQAIDANQKLLIPFLTLDVRQELTDLQLIRKDVLNSIATERLLDTTAQMLTKKLRHTQNSNRSQIIQTTLRRIQIYSILHTLRDHIGMTENGFTHNIVQIYTDTIADALAQIHRLHILDHIDVLRTVQGQGVEFKFASRDKSFLELGKETGDCTADKPLFQADQEVENIYWTVFPWILDRNYQILTVYFNGEFVIKAHILPLYWASPQKSRVILAIDAIETVRAIRDDLGPHHREELIAQRDQIFQSLLDQITRIADRMGIDDVYAERFSNTPWVRDTLSQLPEIFINVNQLIKLDELEDIYELSQTLSRESGHPEVKDIFMELQMKNTSLLPSTTQKIKGIKSFAVVQGDSADGIPIKRVVGI